MGKYDKSAVTKIDKIISELTRSTANRPKATAVSRREGHLLLAEMQGE